MSLVNGVIESEVHEGDKVIITVKLNEKSFDEIMEEGFSNIDAITEDAVRKLDDLKREINGKNLRSCDLGQLQKDPLPFQYNLTIEWPGIKSSAGKI